MEKGDNNQNKYTLSSILFPWRKVGGLKPNRMIQSRLGAQKDIGTSFGFAISALKQRRLKSQCPSCGATSSVSLQEAIQHDSGDTTYILQCNSCDHLQTIEMELEAITKTIDSLRIGERRFLIASAAAACFSFLYYFATGYLFTLICLMLIAVTLLMNSLGLRYRVWQLVHKRLYEKKAPIRDWLKYELSSQT